MILIDTETNKEILIGDRVTNFRGEQFYLRNFRAPHKPGSTGRVGLNNPDGSFAGEFFPSVIGAKIIGYSELHARRSGRI